jgi:LPS sulfotransferase NodH
VIDPDLITRGKRALRDALGLRKDLFKDVPFNDKHHDRLMARTPAHTRYVIFFTPRSGSSRVTELLRGTGVLGNPGEVFNPKFIPRIAKVYSAGSLPDYVGLLLRAHQTGGVFGCEITYRHIERSFRSGKRFLQALRPTACLWLLREDIVAQAVSLSRMRQTGIAHSVQSDRESMIRAETHFSYNPGQILKALQRLHWMESRTEALIQREGLSPLRLSYEKCVGMNEIDFVEQVAAHVGVALPGDIEIRTEHRKVSGSKSDEFAERFRHDHPRLVEKLERRRTAIRPG